MARSVVFICYLALIASLLSCGHKHLTQLPTPAVQELRRVEPLGERQTPGHTPRQVDLESAKALAAIPSQLSLGEWRPIGPWIYAGKAFDVAVSPVDPDTVYAAYGGGGGLWKTSDGGKSWLQLTDRTDLTDIGCVSVHPHLPDVIVACIGGPGDPAARRGIMYSADAGRHWDFIGPADGLSTSFYRAVFHPGNPDKIYVASEKGVYLTDDRGTHWSLILQFPGENADYYDTLPDLVMKPDDPTVLIAAQKNLGVFRTADGGATWARVDSGMDITTGTGVLAWSPSDPNTVYCERDNTDGQHMATYASTDAGVTWTEAANLRFYHQGRYDMALAVDPNNPSRVMLANGDFGISADGLRSYDGYNGYPHVDHLRVVFAPSDPTIVYDANDGGIWRSYDGGDQWYRFDSGVNTNISFGFDIDTSSGKIYLSPADYQSFQYDPIKGWYNSSHGGEWSMFYIDPNDSNTVWFASTGDVAVSHDQGLTWTDVNPDTVDGGPYRAVLRFHPTQSGTIFVLRYPKAWVTRDGGATWADTGIRPNPSDPVLTDMIFDLARPGAAYISENGGIFASTDGGTTWTENKSSVWGLPYYSRVMAPVPGVAGEFYMNADGGMYLVSNGGQKSQSLSGAPFNNISINDLATDFAHPERVYAGTSDGFFISQDYGQSWQRLGRNLPANSVWQISVKGSTIYAGTSQGIWQFSSDVSWQPVPPVNFAVTATSTSSIALSWTPGSNSTGVRIFRDGAQTYVGLESSYSDQGLTPGNSYCYTALDTNTIGEGPLSPPICVSTPIAQGTLPSVALSTAGLQFDYTLGGSLPTGLPIQVANGGSGALSWTGSASVQWLTVTPTTGTAPSTLAVAVNASAASLTPGTYAGKIAVSGPAGVASQSIPVTLKVNSPPPAPVASATADFHDGILVAESYMDTRVQPLTASASASTPMSFVGTVTSVNGNIESSGPEYIAPGGFPFALYDQTRSVVIMHPCSGNCSNPQAAVLAFCSPGSSNYRIQGAFARANSAIGYGVGVQGIVFRNNDLANPLFLATIDPNSPVDPNYYFEEPGSASFDVSTDVSSGDCIRVGVFAKPGASDGTFDATAVKFSITPNEALPLPTFTAAGIVNSASFVAGVVPGSLATIFGQNLSNVQGIETAPGAPWPTQMAGATVTVGGVSAPLYVVANVNGQEQINFQVPFEIAGQSKASIVVSNGISTSQAVPVFVLAAQPGVFTLDGVNAVALHGDNYGLIGPSSPAVRGETIVIYCTGLGPVTPSPGTDAPASSTTLSWTDDKTVVGFGGATASASFSGLAPSYIGLYQINVVVPADAPSGNADLTVTVNGIAGKSVKIAIQ
jgi:uncharacterized protein (TIGR03437 family)